MRGRPVRKRVFNEKDEYVGVANDIDREIYDALEPIFNKWCREQDYSPREVFAIASLTASELMSMHMVRSLWEKVE